MRLVRPTTPSTFFLCAFIIVSTAALGSAQHPDNEPIAKDDASDIAPAPSTWKGAITDSLRLLLMIEHVTRVGLSGQDASGTRR